MFRSSSVASRLTAPPRRRHPPRIGMAGEEHRLLGVAAEPAGHHQVDPLRPRGGVHQVERGRHRRTHGLAVAAAPAAPSSRRRSRGPSRPSAPSWAAIVSPARAIARTRWSPGPAMLTVTSTVVGGQTPSGKPIASTRAPAGAAAARAASASRARQAASGRPDRRGPRPRGGRAGRGSPTSPRGRRRSEPGTPPAGPARGRTPPPPPSPGGGRGRARAGGPDRRDPRLTGRARRRGRAPAGR